jgi:hypothetical protein
MLGLALVVGSVGLLLAGTLYGLNAYLNTIRTTERKLYELQQLNVMAMALQEPTPSDVNSEFAKLTENADKARMFADVYRNELGLTVRQGLDPDRGVMEGQLLNQFDSALLKLRNSLQGARFAQGPEANQPLRHHPDVRSAYSEAERIAGQIKQTTMDDIDRSIRESRGSIR